LAFSRDADASVVRARQSSARPATEGIAIVKPLRAGDERFEHWKSVAEAFSPGHAVTCYVDPSNP
jgi:hypothetical protein